VTGRGKSKGTTTQTTTTAEIEVLNPDAVSDAQSDDLLTHLNLKPLPTNDDDEEVTELPEMTPALVEFSRLPMWDFEKSWLFIQNHREVVVPGATDALLVAAFEAEGDDNPKLAKQCVHQSLLLQYGDKLGRDGLRLFFQR
jgi:cell division cycle protein 37